MSKILTRIILSSALSLISIAAYAEEMILCDDCNLGKRQTISRDGGEGDYYFWDLKNRRLYHMNVTGQATQMRAVGGQKIKEVALTADEQNLFATGMRFYDANGGNAVYKHIQPPVTVSVTLDGNGNPTTAAESRIAARSNGPTPYPMNAMDAVTTPALRAIAIQKTFSLDNMGLYWYMTENLRVNASSLTHAINITKLRTPFTVINQVSFPDGSFFNVEWNWTIRDYSYIPGSARDAVGNVIPDAQKDVANAEQSVQNYVFPNNYVGMAAGDDMVRHLNDLGVRWNGPNRAPVYTNYRIGCSYTPSGAICQILFLTP